MNKYSKEQLQQMAAQTLEARDTGDPRYQLLLMNVCMITGLTSQAVEYKIQAIAQDKKGNSQ